MGNIKTYRNLMEASYKMWAKNEKIKLSSIIKRQEICFSNGYDRLSNRTRLGSCKERSKLHCNAETFVTNSQSTAYPRTGLEGAEGE